MKIEHEAGSRRITFSGFGDHEDANGLDSMEVSVRYTAVDGNVSMGICLDHVIIPAIINALAVHRALLEDGGELLQELADVRTFVESARPGINADQS